MSLISSKAEPPDLTPEAAEGFASIYVHIPFCRTKCPYCSFVSSAGMDAQSKISYIRALERQAREMAGHPWCRARTFHSLFVGGGDPPSADPEKLADFIAACLDVFDFSAPPGKGPEVTLEANPNSINPSMLKRFRQGGVNRLSMGMQAFSDSMLQNIGRRHTVREGMQAFEHARSAGFTNINMDLMYGLPGQAAADWENALQQAVAVAPEHLSVYELTIEPGTPFAELQDQGRLNLPPEDETASMFARARQVLTAAGYEHYEISNYARPGFQCIHNVNYWENGSYLGLGAGGVSCFSGFRVNSVPGPRRYAEMVNRNIHPFQDGEFLGLVPRFRETVIMGLRMTAGVSVQKLQDRFGMTPQDYYGDTLAGLMRQGLLVDKGDRLQLTHRGLPVANQVLSVLV